MIRVMRQVRNRARQFARSQGAPCSPSGLCVRALSTEKPVVPKHAQVVVVGGGVIGTSIAYHLAKMGMKDVVLLEQSKLTSGTTW
jgi:NADPH-dependent 2,4-dienoyl-CoA reductase/sulfur reductase-like enzyme